jgi:hypothetical protein
MPHRAYAHSHDLTRAPGGTCVGEKTKFEVRLWPWLPHSRPGSLLRELRGWLYPYFARCPICSTAAGTAARGIDSDQCGKVLWFLTSQKHNNFLMSTLPNP